MRLTLMGGRSLRVARWLLTTRSRLGWLSSMSFHPADQVFHFLKTIFAKHSAYMIKREDRIRLAY